MPHHIVEKNAFFYFFVYTFITISNLCFGGAAVPCAVMWCAERVFPRSKKRKGRGFHRDIERGISTRG